MTENNFIWVDLSTYHPKKTKKFYETVFDWKYYEIGGYSTAYTNTKEVTGLYETPQKFKNMKMPSFWMSYIQVDSVLDTVETAKSLGGIIELVDTENSLGGIALIRDTLGAGFTIYDGNKLNSRTENKIHTFIFNELHTSSVHKTILFYQKLFNWNVKKINDYSYDIYNTKDEKIAAIKEVDNSIKGKYEYWIIVFAVKNMQTTLQKIEANGGMLIYDEGHRLLCSDGSEAFFYIQKV